MTFPATWPATRPSVAIETHGCKLNQADTSVLAARFASSGFDLVASDQPADVYLVNSCTVTHLADRKARQALRSARRRNPEATIVATGCYAQRDPSALQALREVDLVAGNEDKVRLVEQVMALRGGDLSTCSLGSDEIPVSPKQLRTRAFVKIQEGCDQVCSYCIVPRVRGRERSVPSEEIVERIGAYERAGYREVVLTGTQLGTYGFDLAPRGPTSLAGLVRCVLDGTGIERIRVSSLQPQEIHAELLELWSNPRLCPHFHMPLQSGSDRVLKSMRRRYTNRRYREAVEMIRGRVPGAGLTADVIAGYPGETQGDHAQTADLVSWADFSGLHAFRFSSRPGTTASHLTDDVPPEEKSQRSAELAALAERSANEFRDSQRGSVRSVLWEQKREWGWSGLTDNYIRVWTASETDLLNSIGPAKLGVRSGEYVER